MNLVHLEEYGLFQNNGLFENISNVCSFERIRLFREIWTFILNLVFEVNKMI